MTTEQRLTDAPAVSGLDDHLGFWLRYVSNAVSAEFRKAVEAQGVSVSDWVALRQLFGAGTTSQGALTAALGMTKGAVSKIIARLHAAGLVARRVAPGDARTWHLALTAAGRALVPRLAALADANDARFFGHLTPDARSALMQTLRQVVALRGLTALPTE